MERKKIVVFTGAGVSADSGIATFRDADGLWANYRVEDVCTPEALRNNRSTVIEFYNMRRRESLTKRPNAGHIAIAEMEQWADVQVMTPQCSSHWATSLSSLSRCLLCHWFWYLLSAAQQLWARPSLQVLLVASA